MQREEFREARIAMKECLVRKTEDNAPSYFAVRENAIRRLFALPPTSLVEFLSFESPVKG